MGRNIKTVKVLKTVLSCVVTIGLVLVFLGFSTDLMERKSSDEKYTPFFEQEEDFDVLFMGTSHVINGIFPMELWKDYGIVSYNFGGHSNEFATSYWVMENALDYTEPDLIVIDCVYLGSQMKTSLNISSVHLSLDAFPFSETKLRAVWDLLDDDVSAEANANNHKSEARTAMGFLWNYSVYHVRWEALEKNDFKPSVGKEKGAESRIAVMPYNEEDEIPSDIKQEEDTLAVKYLKKMIEDCQNRGIDVLLIYLPFPAANEDYQKEANRVYDIAEQYGVNYINFLKEDVVNYATDWYDGGHLNPSGARKVTDYLGEYIKEHYDIPDQRANDAYSSWQGDYEEYRELKVKWLESRNALDIYLMLLADKNFSVIIEVNNPEIWKSSYYTALFENLGIDSGKITEDMNLLAIQGAGEQVDYFENFHRSEKKETSFLGELRLSAEESGAYRVYLDDEELYAVTAEQNARADIRIVVMDKDTREILDNVGFSIQSKSDIPEGQITIIGIDRM